MKKIMAIFVVLAMVSVAIPAVLADAPEQTPGTTEIGPENIMTLATVTSGGGLVPFVKCKWETTAGPSGETFPWADDDMDHAGVQVDPVCGGDKTIYYWAICTDPEGVDTISAVYVDVYHPDGLFKYQQPLPNKLNRTCSLAAFEGVYANNPTIIEFNPLKYYDQYGVEHTMNYSEIHYELTQEHAFLWWGQADINYCQPAGLYEARVVAFDNDNQNSEFLINSFWYVPTVCIEYQFSDINYGSVSVGVEKPVGGSSKMARNTGNVPVTFDVEQDDMGLGTSGGLWNVNYAARLGAFGTKVNYDPEVRTTIPDVLGLCTEEKLDFFITITKAFAGDYSGNMDLYAVQNGVPPYATPSQFVDQ
jgi:hypothetical protein